MTDHKKSHDFSIDTVNAALFDTIDEGVIVWNAERVLVYANDSARRITTLPLDPGSVLPPRTLKRNTSAEQTSTIQSNLPAHTAFEGTDVVREQIRFVTIHGEQRWLSVSAHRVHDTHGSLAYVISSMRDVSVRTSRHSKLNFMVASAKILALNLDFEQRLMEKAKLTVPNLADWCSINVYENGDARRVVVVSAYPEKTDLIKLFDEKYPRDKMIAVITSKQAVFIPKVTDAVLQNIATSPEQLADLRALGIRSLMTIPIVSHGVGVGAMTLAYTESGRTYDQSDFDFFQEFCSHVSVVFDNAKLFEEIQTRDKAKEIFLAALSHELRNPLAPIKSSLEILKMRETTPDVREEIELIEHQFDHMAHLLNDLLDVTRFTQDRISITAHPIELRRLIERSLRASDSVIRSADITLHFAYPSMPIPVVADSMRLEQAVSNLIANAVKFTPAGGSIWVDVERDAEHAIVRVRDNGTGIDADDLPNIFDMYYQGRNKGPINSGLGIGLLLVQRIIGMHGGSVEAQSEGRGKGSEFTLRLPRADVFITEQQQAAAPSLARSLRILVVDDNAPAADSLVRLLNKLGARAHAVYSGHEALGCERLSEIDLFLLDVGMPQMDGYELVGALRTQGIVAPIVALTGYGLSEDKDRAALAGFTSHLTKPVGLAELNTMFEHVLSPASV